MNTVFSEKMFGYWLFKANAFVCNCKADFLKLGNTARVFIKTWPLLQPTMNGITITKQKISKNFAKL